MDMKLHRQINQPSHAVNNNRCVPVGSPPVGSLVPIAALVGSHLAGALVPVPVSGTDRLDK